MSNQILALLQRLRNRFRPDIRCARPVLKLALEPVSLDDGPGEEAVLADFEPGGCGGVEGGGGAGSVAGGDPGDHGADVVEPAGRRGLVRET